MSTSQGNIFLTMENLAFSLPLLFVCGSYAYVKFVPKEYGLPILGALFVLYQIRAQMKARHAKKLQNMDDKAMMDLALELEGDDSKEKEEAAKKQQQKKKAKVEQRLAAERKKNAKSKNKKKAVAEDDDDDDNLETFANVSKNKKKKKN